jgi:hypothetical protein
MYTPLNAPESSSRLGAATIRPTPFCSLFVSVFIFAAPTRLQNACELLWMMRMSAFDTPSIYGANTRVWEAMILPVSEVSSYSWYLSSSSRTNRVCRKRARTRYSLTRASDDSVTRLWSRSKKPMSLARPSSRTPKKFLPGKSGGIEFLGPGLRRWSPS